MTGNKNSLPGDLYALSEHLPRQTVKAWMTQAFATGEPMTRWARNIDMSARVMKSALFRCAAVLAYPAFSDLQVVLPSDVVTTVLFERLVWAVGHYLTFVESEITGEVVSNLREQGILALPLHDALIVARDLADDATAALSAAFFARLYVAPVIKVNSLTHGDTLGSVEQDVETEV